MIFRPYWIECIKNAWKKRSVVWLSGVRRVGKTTLAKMLKDTIYLNCDLPSVERRLEDPESFFDELPKMSTVIFDEIHHLHNPSRILKIAADEYNHLKILATGSSTLAATKKFRDSLTGRKINLYISPVLWTECQNEFGIGNLDHRLLHGGLPEPFLSSKKDSSFFSEWIDSFYARDILELFSIHNRTGFLKLLHLLMRQSGGLVDYTNLAQLSGLSRPTVKAHIEAMSIAHALYLLPPFHGGGRREIIKRTKCYSFDTGFVTFAKGWNTIRDEDRGILWEHIVLDTLRTGIDPNDLFFWRDKSGREIDFIVKESDDTLTAIECKINPDKYDLQSFIAFRERYHSGRNLVVSPIVKSPYSIKHKPLKVNFFSVNSLLSGSVNYGNL